MRIELDTEANTLYLYIRDEILDGEAVRTLEVEDGVYLDLDSENRPLGLEFVHADDFQDFLKRHGGRVQIPDVVENLESLRFSIAQ